MKISIIGAGCVGSVIAEQLVDKKYVSVSFIAEGVYKERLIDKGDTVNGRRYNIPLLMKGEYPDVVFVCVKSYDLEKACEDIKPFVSKETIIIPLLNSISPTPFIQSVFPENRVLFGYISGIDSCADSGSFRYNIAGDLHFGYANNKTVRDELLKIKKAFDDTDFRVYIDADMIKGVWKKWMLNIGANQVSALTEADYLQFSRIPEIGKVLMLAMQELLILAGYENVELSTKDVLEIMEYLTTYPYPKKTSMLQDIQERRKTEIDYISGDLLKLSRKWNCPCPVNLTMYYLIKSKEKAYLP